MTNPVISEEEAAALLERASHPGEARPLDLAKLRIVSGKLPVLETVNQSFAAAFAKSMTKLVKREVQATLQSIETHKAEDYFATLSMPACIDVVAAKPIQGQVLFCLDTTLLSALVDGYYGGPGRSIQRNPDQPLTPAELRFAQQVLKQMFADLKQAWVPLAPIELEVIKHESNPRLIEGVAPEEMLLVNRFLLELPGGTGTVDFVIPEKALDPLRDKMRGDAGAAPRATSTVNWRAAMTEHLKNIEVQVRGVLAESRLNLRDLKGLKPGDVIPVPAPGPATLLVGRVPVYSGKFGISREHNALKLTAPQMNPRKST